jgi:hypothetical protein
LPKVLENLGAGVMEYWSVGKKRHLHFGHYSNTPVLQYSEID